MLQVLITLDLCPLPEGAGDILFLAKGSGSLSLHYKAM